MSIQPEVKRILVRHRPDDACVDVNLHQILNNAKDAGPVKMDVVETMEGIGFDGKKQAANTLFVTLVPTAQRGKRMYEGQRFERCWPDHCNMARAMLGRVQIQVGQRHQRS